MFFLSRACLGTGAVRGGGYTRTRGHRPGALFSPASCPPLSEVSDGRGGTPSWEGQNLEDCERQINTFGLGAFKAESQHEGQTTGGLFQRDWFEIVDGYPHEAQLVRFWDMAATEPQPGTDPDWTVGVLMAAWHGQFWIVDVERLRGSPLTVEKRVRQTADLDTRRVAIHIEQEGGSAGPTVIDHYQRRVLTGYAVYGERKTEDKSTRAKPLASAAEAGNVFIVRGAWNRDFLDEIDAVFGGGAGHDDQADAASGAHTVLAPRNHRPGTAVAGVQSVERRRFSRVGLFGPGWHASQQLDVPPSQRRRR